MKILVVSGFLGAGKTTFINELVRRINKPINILENEYADINIDKDLFENKESIYEMTEGCICCTRQNDFATTVLTISNTLDPYLLIIEPTGLAKLKNVLDNINKVSYERIEILSPVTLVDLKNHDSFKRDYPDIYLNQIKHGGTLIITKNDGDEVKNEFLKEELKEYISSEYIIDKDYRKLSDDWWYSLLERRWTNKLSFSKNIIKEKSEEPDYFSISQIGFESHLDFNSTMNAVLQGRFGKIIRAKGFFKVDDSFIKIDIVGDSFSIEEIKEKDESHLILIGKNLLKNDLNKLFSFYQKD